MSLFKKKVQKNVDIPEKLVTIGRIFYDSSIRYQQREYARLLAIQKHKEMDAKIQKLRESGVPQTHALRTLIAMHEDERPGELYEAMKSMILDTTAEALFQLDDINRVYATQYTVEYCMQKAFERTSKEEMLQSFISEQMESGINSDRIDPMLGDADRMKDFIDAVYQRQARNASDEMMEPDWKECVMSLGKKPMR